MSTVFIPSGAARQRRWRQVPRDRRRVDPGVVDELVEEHPSLRGQLLTDEGELNRFVNVYVNGQDVRYLAGLETPVAPADEVRLLPAMAGG